MSQHHYGLNLETILEAHAAAAEEWHSWVLEPGPSADLQDHDDGDWMNVPNGDEVQPQISESVYVAIEEFQLPNVVLRPFQRSALEVILVHAEQA